LDRSALPEQNLQARVPATNSPEKEKGRQKLAAFFKTLD
jgi:hypothetical protein